MFARYLRDAMGLGATAAFAFAASGCGGNVVVDLPDDTGGAGGGGGGGTSASVGVTSSSAGGPYACGETVTPSQKLVYACLDGPPPASCPSASEATSALAAKLNADICAEFCCHSESVVSVPCGPDPTAVNCCYTAKLLIGEEMCMGLPFSVEGEARTAAMRERSDWNVALAPSLERLDPATRVALAEAWTRDALAEHASIAAFARFVMELLSVGAPVELVSDAQRAIGDEIRHAEMCFGLASAYAGAPRGPSELRIQQALAGRDDPKEIARSVVRGGAVGETIAALSAVAARQRVSDPAVAGVLDAIATDEAAHAALAWRYLMWALGSGDEALHSAVEAEIEAAIEEIAPESSPAVSEVVPSALRAHGRLSEVEAREVARRAMVEVIAPCARELLGASRWLARRERAKAAPAPASVIREPVARLRVG
ncbi:ferritin-like domain-containing protein [Polyangium aurulentum]|uniref:ferritin-like domain-containing protein n=1 Tax=Polyangium aurulentum TaxID=2567896 RepID=UPI00146BDD4F|nr:ferritin-like domain-containing protein [Polyangium aurulentum]UQA54695.1 ferritin-like domain-containing protein [Polyangium aurulentum]